MKINLPEQVQKIIRILTAAGYEAYAVGGCVRDSLIGRIPDDWDITTSAKPEEVKRLFKRTVDTGIAHGTVTVLMDRIGYEVTTYRIDGEYEDGRHPKGVTFTASLSEDLCRRDFTMNAMAYSDEEGLMDPYCGAQDIEAGIIRCVGNPIQRFSEDALRMMRAVRFAAQLGYRIDEETENAIRKLAPDLQKVSAERIQVELIKMLVSPNPYLLKRAYELGITAQVLPEFDVTMQTPQNTPYHCYCVGEHILHTMEAIEPEKVLRLTMLFHDISKPRVRTTGDDGSDHFYGHAKLSADTARAVLRRLKFDTDTINKVEKLVRFHDYRIEPGMKSMRHAMNTIGEECFPELFLVHEADMRAKSEIGQKCATKRLLQNRADYEAICSKNECISRKNLAVTGRDLLACNIASGKEIGDLLNEMLADVLDFPEHNEKEYLLNHFVRK